MIIFSSVVCAYLFVDGLLQQSDIGFIQMLFSVAAYFSLFIGVL